MGLCCEGFADQFLVLLTAIEAGFTQFTKFVTKKQSELKRLTWPLNYEGSSSCERPNGKGLDSSI